ncbi:MAG: helicase-exonuclease AddAB subunit AddA [Bacillota bacterium]|nr:helicase-exonuclease AddAB subunit AddA [Bacillota bacterium]
MGDTKWTKEQQEAIDTRGCNLLVAAAAGSGKTAVLVERIIKIITNEDNPIDIDKLLIVTFTNAAAAEMRERIGMAIAEALDKNPENKNLQMQLTLLNKASITTIHSFCLEVIRNNFHYIDIDPNFRIADATECTLLKQETILELFEESYELKDYNDEEEKNKSSLQRQMFLNLVECYGGSKEDFSLQNIVLNIYEFVMSGPWPYKWLEEMSEEFNVKDNFDFGNSKWGKVLIDSIKIELTGYKSIMEDALSIIEASEGLEPYITCFQNEIDSINKMIKSCDVSWKELYQSVKNANFDKLKPCKKNADKDIQDRVKKVRDDVKKYIKTIQTENFSTSADEIKNYMKELYPLIKCLSKLVIEFNEKYSAKKRDKNLLDFNDLEHFCLEILTIKDENENILPSEAAMEIKSKYDEILIDEYQDSNNVQEVIMNMVSRRDLGKPNVFMVGDVKQSIYRFRQAEPGLFLEKYNSYSEMQGYNERKITLFKNFRSRKEIIDAVNFIFKQIMSVNIGELEYDDKEALNLGAEYKKASLEGSTGGPVEIHLIEKNQKALGEKSETDEENSKSEDSLLNEEEELTNIQLESRVVGKRIKELISQDGNKGFKVYDKNINDYRAVQYRDIVILLRATAKWSPIFMEELNNLGIPVYADTGTGYFTSIEIQTIMSLLQIIDNPVQDIPLLAVLRSPIFSFSPEELLTIRLAEKEVPFYEAVKKLSIEAENTDFNQKNEFTKLKIDKLWYESLKNEIAVGITEDINVNESYNNERVNTANKAFLFLQKLDKWRKASIHMPIDELIWYLYTETGYYAYTAAMPGGVQRQANLKILFQRAKQFEKTSYKGLFNFITFINRLRTNSGDMGSAKILGENENVVRIMSIHKSKGLEFPVVIVSAAGKNFNLMDINRNILYHNKLGFGPDYVDYKKRISYPTVLKQAIKKKIKIESLSEEMRVLYVAFTRAKEKLIITGAVKDTSKSAAKWCSIVKGVNLKVPEYEILKGKNFLDWIGLAIVRHEDAETLRKIGMNCDILKDTSKFKIKVWEKNDIVSKKEENLISNEEDNILNDDKSSEENKQVIIQDKQNFETKMNSIKDSAFKSEVYKKLSYEYPYKFSSYIPANLSVTELKRQSEEEIISEEAVNIFKTPELIKKPQFLEKAKGLNSSEKGTAMHSVMQHLILSKNINEEDILVQIGKMVDNEILTMEQSQTVNTKKIDRFFKSVLGTRMLNSNKIEREVLFHIKLRCTDIYKELEKEMYKNDSVLLQGAIDCYFEEEDGLVLIDYKTDYVTEDKINEIKNRYKAQIEYYTEALLRVTGKKVKERYIYLFWNGETINYT